MNPEEELSTPPYPTLDTTGWLTKPEAKADAVLLGYLQASYSQSVLFAGQIRSLQYSIQQNQRNQAAMQQAVIDDCKEIFSAYFDFAEAACTVKDIKNSFGAPGAKYDIEISVDVIQNGVNVSVGRMISVIDSKVVRYAPLSST